jgi:hypothetical protein
MNIAQHSDKEVLTVDQAAERLAKNFSAIWKRINTKHIDNPSTHAGFKPVAVALASACAQSDIARNQRQEQLLHDFFAMRSAKETNQKNFDSRGSIPPSGMARTPTTNQLHVKDGVIGNNLGAITAVLEQHDFPAYYVTGPLLKSMMHTKPPQAMQWSEVFFPFPALLFMIPLDALQEPVTGNTIMALGVCKFNGNTTIMVPGTTIRIEMTGPQDRICVFWITQQGLTIQDCTFPDDQLLEPSAEWIDERTEHWIDINGMQQGGPDSQFSSFVSGLVANLLLVMQARKELVEPGQRTNKTLKSGARVHAPTFIGRKYQIMRHVDNVPANGPTARFTELGWRSGYLRSQHYGKGNKETKIVLIDPYIAFSKGLQRIEPA